MLSIITPVSRPSERLLSEAAESVEKLAAIHPQPIQWLLASDGVPLELIKKWVGSLERVECTYIPPVELPENTVGRASLARNRALPLAKYEWICNLDDDDMLIPEGIASLLDQALESSYGWIAGDMQLLKEGTYEACQLPEVFEGLMEPGLFRSYLERHRIQPFGGGCGMVRRDILQDIGGWPVLPYHQDTQLWLDITDAHGGLATQELVYVWRRHSAQMTPPVLGTRPPMWR